MAFTPLHFLFRPVLIARGSQEYGIRDTATLYVRETRIRIAAQMQVRVQDRSTPRQIRLSRHVRSGGHRGKNRLEKPPSLHDITC